MATRHGLKGTFVPFPTLSEHLALMEEQATNIIVINGDEPQQEEYHPISAADLHIYRMIWTQQYETAQKLEEVRRHKIVALATRKYKMKKIKEEHGARNGGIDRSVNGNGNDADEATRLEEPAHQGPPKAFEASAGVSRD